MFSPELWRAVFEHHRARVPALVDFVLNPAHGALPSRVARALRVSAEPVRATLPYDARPWSRCLLLGYAELEAASPELNCDMDMIWFASQGAAQQMRVATHLGALQLALPLRRRVSARCWRHSSSATCWMPCALPSASPPPTTLFCSKKPTPGAANSSPRPWRR